MRAYRIKKKEGGFIHVQPYFDLGALAHGLGQHRKAVLYYRKEIAQSNSSKAHYNLGVLFHHRKRYHAAADEYKKAIKGNSQLHEAYYNLGLCCKKLEQFNQAISAFKRAVKLCPNDLSYVLNLAVVYVDAGSYERAVAMFKKAGKSKTQTKRRKRVHENYGVPSACPVGVSGSTRQ